MAGAPVALLHTAAVHVEAFAARVRALDPQQVLLQAVDEHLLAQASMAALADQAPAASGGWAAGLPVLCSPGLGVRALLGRADG